MFRAIDGLSPEGDRPNRGFSLEGAWERTKADLVGKEIRTDTGVATIGAPETAELILWQVFDRFKTPGVDKLVPGGAEYNALMRRVIETVRVDAGLGQLDIEN